MEFRPVNFPASDRLQNQTPHPDAPMILWRSRVIAMFSGTVYINQERGMTAGSPQGEFVPIDSNRRRTPARLAAVAALLLAACFLASPAPAQYTTASRIGDLQVGGGFVWTKSGYNFTPIQLYGVSAYTTFDARPHWGGEFDFHRVSASQDSTIRETTFEIGPRVFATRGRLVPYAKVLYGRGVYNFHQNIANIAYNIYTYGGGADFRATRSINVRADYEYQNWMGFPLATLHPSVVTIGVAYHFHE
jgi:opacity protein-like surface antigen